MDGGEQALGYIHKADTCQAQDIVDESDNVANPRKYARQRWTKQLKKLEAP